MQLVNEFEFAAHNDNESSETLPTTRKALAGTCTTALNRTVNVVGELLTKIHDKHYQKVIHSRLQLAHFEFTVHPSQHK